jgi:hypothetical protein
MALVALNRALWQHLIPFEIQKLGLLHGIAPAVYIQGSQMARVWGCARANGMERGMTLYS